MHCFEVSIWQQLLKLQYYGYLDTIYRHWKVNFAAMLSPNYFKIYFENLPESYKNFRLVLAKKPFVKNKWPSPKVITVVLFKCHIRTN